MKGVCFLFLILFLRFPVPAAVDLVNNGVFAGEAAANLPADWECGGDGEVEWDREADPSVLRFRATAPKQFTFARQTVPLPEKTPAALRLMADLRLDGVERGENSWHSGRLMLTYLDGEGREIGNAYGLDRLEGETDWTEVSRQFPVEPGAVAVKLELQLFYAGSGSIGFRNVRLLALNDSGARAWRTEADARIERHRMADLRVTVTDSEGRPLPKAEVAVRMRRHAYPFGTAVKTNLLLSDEPEAEIYQGVVTNFFNSATFEGALKDRVIERRGLEPAVEALHWLRDRGMRVRGHVLIWPSWEMTPHSYKALAENPDALRAERAYFAKVLSATGGLIYEWDVVNEPIRHHDLIRLLGREQVVEWFRMVREFAPDVPLMMNENNVLFNAGNRQAYIEWLKYLQAHGAPIDRVGVQGHMWHRTMPSGQNVLQDLEALSSPGLPVVLTEYSANSRFSEAEEARYLDELLHAWFSHPLTAGFTVWGFKDDLIWTDNAFFLREDWSLKPAGEAWLERVYGDWWTEADLVTDTNGSAVLRGFKGDYVVEVRLDGRRIRREVSLGDTGVDLELRLDEEAETHIPGNRIGSFNPWTTGKLPSVQARKDSPDPAGKSVSLPVRDMAAVPEQKAAGGVFPLRGHDLYLRVAVPKAAVDRVELRIAVAETGSKPGRVSVHALSHRFVPQEGELGLAWKPEDLGEENAPGRSAADGGFDLGDARVLFVGYIEIPADATGTVLAFSNTELRRLTRESAGKDLTLILSGSGADNISLAGPGHPDLPSPSLFLETRKD